MYVHTPTYIAELIKEYMKIIVLVISEILNTLFLIATHLNNKLQ